MPNKYWISAFYFPQAFIAAIKQNYSRKNKIEFNKIAIDFEFMSSDGSAFLTEKPEDGCYVEGFFIEGAKFEELNKTLIDSVPREL